MRRISGAVHPGGGRTFQPPWTCGTSWGEVCNTRQACVTGMQCQICLTFEARMTTHQYVVCSVFKSRPFLHFLKDRGGTGMRRLMSQIRSNTAALPDLQV